MTEHPFLTAIILTRNEEANLPGCLANLRGVADEVIVVDDASTDRTAEIALLAEANVQLLSHPMSREQGFAGQRNAGIRAARGTWLLHMDCDERLSPDLARELAEILPRSRLNAYRYRRLNYFLHRPMRHGGWNGWNRPQIARRGCHRFTGPVHEACVIEGGEAAIGQCRSPMHHLNEPDFAHRLRKSEQYARMEADRLERAGTRARAIDIALRPPVEFARKYVLKGGLRDGVPGLIAALHAASAVFRIYALLWDRQNRLPRADLESAVSRESRA